jgi:integrase/recombinase XerD
MEDVNWEKGQVWIREGKGTKERFVLYTEECGLRLKEYHNQREVESDYLFSDPLGRPIRDYAVRKWFKGYTQELQPLLKITPHSMRHTFAAHLAKKGMPIKYIQELLGHACFMSTKIYTRLFADVLKKQLDQYR